MNRYMNKQEKIVATLSVLVIFASLIFIVKSINVIKDNPVRIGFANEPLQSTASIYRLI